MITTFTTIAAASGGIPQAPATVKARAAPAARAGPPRGPGARRVARRVKGPIQLNLGGDTEATAALTCTAASWEVCAPDSAGRKSGSIPGRSKQGRLRPGSGEKKRESRARVFACARVDSGPAMFLLPRNRFRPTLSDPTSGGPDEKGKRPFAQAFIAARAELPVNAYCWVIRPPLEVRTRLLRSRRLA